MARSAGPRGRTPPSRPSPVHGSRASGAAGRRRSGERGAASVELAVTFPVVLLLVMTLIQSRMPLRGTSKDENRGRSPVEPGNVTGAASPSFSLAPGSLGTNNCRREHECQSLRCAKTPRAATLITSQGGPRDGRTGGSVRGAGRAQGHRDGGGAPPGGDWFRPGAGGTPVPHLHLRAARAARLVGR